MAKRLTIEEVLERLGISKPTMYNLIARGLLTKYQSPFGKGRGGRRVWFLAEQVTALKNNRGDVKGDEDD